MVACLLIGCSHAGTDHQHSTPSSPSAVEANATTANATPFFNKANSTLFHLSPSTSTTTAISNNDSATRRHISTSSSASAADSAASDCSNSAVSFSAASTSAITSTTTSTSTGRRHGKRQKGQPYIPSYMDLSAGPEPCVVCGDSATGYHYRAMTCEGCKGFFRRTVQKGLKYDCKFGGGCSVDKRTRNQCQQCRYIRCLTVGMAADLVLNEGERLAKRRLIEQNRERRKMNSGSQQSTASGSSSTPRESVPPIDTLIKQTPTQPDDDSSKSAKKNEAKREEVSVDSQLALTESEQALIDAVVASYNNTLQRLGDHLRRQQASLSSEQKKSWRQVTELLAPAIVKVVEFAKMLPGFAELDNADQVLLLRSGCIEVLCLRVASRPSFKSRLEQARKTAAPLAEAGRDEKSQLSALIEPIIEFSNGISKLALDTTETALLAAVLLMQSDRSGLVQPDRVEFCQDRILSAYRKYVCQRRPSQPMHWAKILMKVTDVRAISLKYSEKVLSVSVDDTPAPELVLDLLYDDDDDETSGVSDNASSSSSTYTASHNDGSANSPYFTSSDLPSSPLSYADSSASGRNPASASKLTATGEQTQPSLGSNTTNWLQQPASPDSAASVMSSSSGSGRSAISPQSNRPLAETGGDVSPVSSFALHQLASIALDPSLYRLQASSMMAANPFSPWPGASVLFLPQLAQNLSSQPNNNFSHQQILAAAAAAAAAASNNAVKAVKNEQVSQTNKTNQTTPPASSSSSTLKSSKYSISSLIA